MKIIVGLGNIGTKYVKNRHNVGFILLDNYAEILGVKFAHSDKVSSLVTQTDGLRLCKPQTFMNNSGDAVIKMSKFYKVLPKDICIIHDDLDLEFGVVKFQFGRGSAGHNGVLDIINKLGTQDFWRLRVGIGRPKDDTSATDYVLKDFTQEQISVLRDIDLNEYILVEE